MSKQKDSEFETYTIPPNFIEGSTLFGGLFKLRNAIEAGVLAIGAGLPVFLLNIPLTTRIIVLCLTALPPCAARAVRRIGRVPVVLYLCFLQVAEKPARGRRRF